MITQEKKDENITCTGQGLNCEGCVDGKECVDYTEYKELKI